MNNPEIIRPIAMLWIAFCVGTPFVAYCLGHVEHVGDFASWASALAVGLIGLFGIPQLTLARSSTEIETLLKVSEIIEDVTFDSAYRLIRVKSEVLERIAAMEDLCAASTAINFEGNLRPSSLYVLNALERIGLIFEYATNKSMIEECVGDVVVVAYELLQAVIRDYQRDDPTLYDHVARMYRYIKPRWKGDSAQRIQPPL